MRTSAAGLLRRAFLLLAAVSFISMAYKAPAGDPLHLADPVIFFHNGTYYLYGTGDKNAGDGFQVYTSKDMRHWEGPKGARDGYALKKGDAFGTKGFWAPQVFYYQHKFYMAYTANENIAIAVSDSPLGPFTQSDPKALEAPVKQIDPYLFIDDDGKKYLYHVRLTNGNRIFVAEMEDDLSAIRPGTLREAITAEQGWENTANAPWPVAEGPTVLKHNNLYYLFYSANDFRNPDYAVGYAVSTHPLGPWKKYSGSPVLSRQLIGHNGTGHGDFIRDGKGGLHYVFHTHFSNTAVGPRKTAIIKAQFQPNGDADKLVMPANSFYFPEKVQ